MKNRILLFPVLLTLAACGHIPARVPSQNEIQREAPPGGLVRVTLRDAKEPSRFTTYLVDVSRNEVVSKVDSPALEEKAGQDSTSTKSESATSTKFVMSSVEVYTDCTNPKPQPGCESSPGAVNGDPGDGSGGGGDPTGHDPMRRVLRLAALSFWSLKQVAIPISQNQMTQTRGQ